jgi:Flp pilus assembly protein TadG
MEIVSKRKCNRRGSVVLEAGLTIVLLFAQMFLVMDLSLLIFTKSTLQQAVREGVRVGITGRVPSSGTYLNDAIIQTVQQKSLGLLNGTQGACKIRVDYYDPNSGSASTGTQGDVLVVSVNRFNFTPVGALLRSADPLAISVSSSDIIERCSVSGCPATVNPQPIACP